MKKNDESWIRTYDLIVSPLCIIIVALIASVPLIILSFLVGNILGMLVAVGINTRIYFLAVLHCKKEIARIHAFYEKSFKERVFCDGDFFWITGELDIRNNDTTIDIFVITTAKGTEDRAYVNSIQEKRRIPLTKGLTANQLHKKVFGPYVTRIKRKKAYWQNP